MEKEVTDSPSKTSPYEFICRVKEALTNEKPTLIKFTGVMKAFHNKQIEIEELLAQVPEILQGHDNILNEFNEFLPPEKKLPLSTDTTSNVAIITPQPSKLKKVKVVAPSSPAPKRTKATRHPKSNYQQVMFSPPTPTNTNLPSLKEVFGGASTSANTTTACPANPLATNSFPLAAEQEDCLKVFISKLIAKYTTNSPKYSRESPSDFVIEIIQLFAREDLDLLHAFANLLCEPNKRDLLRAMQEFQLTLALQSPRKSPAAGEDPSMGSNKLPLTPIGMMHMAHHTVASATESLPTVPTVTTPRKGKGVEDTVTPTKGKGSNPLVTPQSSAASNKAATAAWPSSGLTDSKTSTAYSLPSIHTVGSSPPEGGADCHLATLDTIDTLFTCNSQQGDPLLLAHQSSNQQQQQQPREMYASAEEWKADQQRLKSFQYVFRVRAALRDQPDTYRKFLSLLGDYKLHSNLSSLFTELRSMFGETHPELMAGFLQLLP